MFLPRPKNITAWKLIPHRSKISKNWNPPRWVPLDRFFKNLFLLIQKHLYSTYVITFKLILLSKKVPNVYDISFLAVVVFGLGKNLLFYSRALWISTYMKNHVVLSGLSGVLLMLPFYFYFTSRNSNYFFIYLFMYAIWRSRWQKNTIKLIAITVWTKWKPSKMNQYSVLTKRQKRVIYS